MENKKQVSVVSQVIGLLIQCEVSSLEAQQILKEVEKTFLERCWHISSNKNYRKSKTDLERFFDEESDKLISEKLVEADFEKDLHSILWKIGGFNATESTKINPISKAVYEQAKQKVMLRIKKLPT